MSDEITSRLEQVFRSVVTGMGLEATVRVGSSAEAIGVDIDGDGLEPLIGRDGAVIDALQYLAHQMALRSGAQTGRVVVDVAGYRDRRRRQLEKLAEHAASEAIRYSEEIELDAMTPQDRRIVHMALAERTDIVTRSEGQEPNRRVIVEPAGSADREGASDG